jgi:hypothetical protein
MTHPGIAAHADRSPVARSMVARPGNMGADFLVGFWEASRPRCIYA